MIEVKEKVKEELRELRDIPVDVLYEQAQKRLDEVNQRIKEYEDVFKRQGSLGSAWMNYQQYKSEHHWIIKNLKDKLIMRMILRQAAEDDI